VVVVVAPVVVVVAPVVVVVEPVVVVVAPVVVVVAPVVVVVAPVVVVVTPAVVVVAAVIVTVSNGVGVAGVNVVPSADGAPGWHDSEAMTAPPSSEAVTLSCVWLNEIVPDAPAVHVEAGSDSVVVKSLALSSPLLRLAGVGSVMVTVAVDAGSVIVCDPCVVFDAVIVTLPDTGMLFVPGESKFNRYAARKRAPGAATESCVPLSVTVPPGATGFGAAVPDIVTLTAEYVFVALLRQAFWFVDVAPVATGAGDTARAATTPVTSPRANRCRITLGMSPPRPPYEQHTDASDAAPERRVAPRSTVRRAFGRVHPAAGVFSGCPHSLVATPSGHVPNLEV
jgi:hypothetical protein